MNNTQRLGLEAEIDLLLEVNATEVTHSIRWENDASNNARAKVGEIKRRIIAFVESLTTTRPIIDSGNLDDAADDPLFGMVYDDPRAGFRPCIVDDCGEAFWHPGWHTDGDGDVVGVIEYPDGQVQVDLAEHIQFTDVPEAQQ
jgi:hypothetical protein